MPLFKHLHDLLLVVLLGFSTLLQFLYSPFLHSKSGELGEVIPTLFLPSSAAHLEHANTWSSHKYSLCVDQQTSCPSSIIVSHHKNTHTHRRPTLHLSQWVTTRPQRAFRLHSTSKLGELCLSSSKPSVLGVFCADNFLRPSNHAQSHAEHGVHHTSAIKASDLSHNLEAKIKNPLAGIPKHELMAQVEEFAAEKGVTEYIDFLKKGALVAQDPDNYQEIHGEHKLDDAEIYSLQREMSHKWRVPKMLYMTIITCSIGAAVQGWDQEGSNGANLSFPQALGLDESTDFGTYIVGLINAAPYFGSAYVQRTPTCHERFSHADLHSHRFIGCWLSDPLNYYLGRRGKFFI